MKAPTQLMEKYRVLAQVFPDHFGRKLEEKRQIPSFGGDEQSEIKKKSQIGGEESLQEDVQVLGGNNEGRENEGLIKQEQYEKLAGKNIYDSTVMEKQGGKINNSKNNASKFRKNKEQGFELEEKQKEKDKLGVAGHENKKVSRMQINQSLKKSKMMQDSSSDDDNIVRPSQMKNLSKSKQISGLQSNKKNKQSSISISGLQKQESSLNILSALEESNQEGWKHPQQKIEKPINIEPVKNEFEFEFKKKSIPKSIIKIQNIFQKREEKTNEQVLIQKKANIDRKENETSDLILKFNEGLKNRSIPKQKLLKESQKEMMMKSEKLRQFQKKIQQIPLLKNRIQVLQREKQSQRTTISKLQQKTTKQQQMIENLTRQILDLGNALKK